jgi:hypothetical protein
LLAFRSASRSKLTLQRLDSLQRETQLFAQLVDRCGLRYRLCVVPHQRRPRSPGRFASVGEGDRLGDFAAVFGGVVARPPLGRFASSLSGDTCSSTTVFSTSSAHAGFVVIGIARSYVPSSPSIR